MTAHTHLESALLEPQICMWKFWYLNFNSAITAEITIFLIKIQASEVIH